MAALDDEPEIQTIDEEVLPDFDPDMDALSSQMESLAVGKRPPKYLFAKSQLFFYDIANKNYAYDYMRRSLLNDHGEKVNFDGKTVLIIINVHGGIVVRDGTPLTGTTYVDPKGVLNDFETTGPLSPHTLDVPVPRGKNVFHYKLSSKEVVYHRNYRLRDTEKLFKKLKLISQRMSDSAGGGGITGNMLATYAQLFIRSAQKDHREFVDLATPYVPRGAIKDVDVVSSVFSNIKGYDPLIECAYSSQKDVDKNQSIACFTDSTFTPPELQESFIYDETLAPPGSKFQISLSEIIHNAFSMYPGAENLIIADASCAVKRHESSIRQAIKVADAVQHKASIPAQIQLAKDIKDSLEASLQISDLASDPGSASASGSMPGGKKSKKSKIKRKQSKKRKKSKRKYI